MAEICAACGGGQLEPHLRVAGDAGRDGLIPDTGRYGTALADIVRCRDCGHMQLERFPPEEDLSEDSIEALKARRTEKPPAVVDEDESDLAEGYELPGADLSGEELLVRVMPAQADEFTCASCFLVRHRSQIAREKDGLKYCKDCEG